MAREIENFGESQKWDLCKLLDQIVTNKQLTERKKQREIWKLFNREDSVDKGEMIDFLYQNGYVDILKLFFKTFPHFLNLFRGDSPLHQLSYNGDVEKVKLFLKTDPNLSVVWSVHIAASKGFKEIVEILIRHEPESVNYISSYSKEIPLHDAAEHNYEEIFEFLVKNGSNLSVINNDGKTPADMFTNIDLRVKFKKLEHAYIQVKPIIDKILMEENLSDEEKILIGQAVSAEEASFSEDMQNIKSCILNIIKFEIKKILYLDKIETLLFTEVIEEAIELIGIFHKKIPLLELKLYQTMINQYFEIMRWEIEKSLFPQKILPVLLSDKILECLSPEDSEFITSEQIKSDIINFTEALLKFDCEGASEIYKKLDIIHDKYIAKITEIADSKTIFPQLLSVMDVAVQMPAEASTDIVDELQSGAVGVAGAGAGPSDSL